MKSAEFRAASIRHRPWLWTLAALGLVLAWESSGWDLALAQLMAPHGTFAWREHWLLASLLHDDARRLAWLVGAWLALGLRWPTGILRRIPAALRLQWFASLLLGLLLVDLLKHFSRSSCPWDLAEFGGHAQYLGHWLWRSGDGGPGGCFPAGHAGAGFALVGGFFAFRRQAPRLALVCLAVAVGSGTVLGLAQQLRGAHFMSHTLWTAWLCWFVAWTVDAFARQAGWQPQPVILASHEIS